jgi:CheY-like chemotaxis protein
MQSVLSDLTNGPRVIMRGDEIAAVVTDVVMPGLGGGALAKRIAELRPTLPVLFTSAYSGEDVVRRGLIPEDAPIPAEAVHARGAGCEAAGPVRRERYTDSCLTRTARPRSVSDGGA